MGPRVARQDSLSGYAGERPAGFVIASVFPEMRTSEGSELTMQERAEVEVTAFTAGVMQVPLWVRRTEDR